MLKIDSGDICFNKTTAVTQNECKRIAYFIGHKEQPLSAMIVQICMNYETFSKILFEGEGATRTLINLYNLHTVRGALNSEKQLIYKTSMSGPHHYFGWIDPTKSHTISFHKHNAPIYFSHLDKPIKCILNSIENKYITHLERYEWISGSQLNLETRELFTVCDELLYHLYDNSIFDKPGILILDDEILNMHVIDNPHLYDFSPYRAQIVPNNSPFMFDQTLISENKYAQLKLRIITYNYAERYVEDYLMKGSGIFIERHEFIQAITPMNDQCGGFVLLGKENKKSIDLVATRIPFGYTLLVDPWAIHGDSTLIGLYMMAMTGDHHAMQTADSVFLKNRNTRKNIIIDPIFASENHICLKESCGNNFYLTSDEKPLDDLREDDREIKQMIVSNIQYSWWRPEIDQTFSVIGSNLISSGVGKLKYLKSIPQH